MASKINPSSSHRVIVIGAGVSGLACACELRQRGYQVLVIEARSRPGGRLKSTLLRLAEGEETEKNTDVFIEEKCAKENGRKKIANARSQSTSTNGKTNEDEPEPEPGVRVDMGGALIHGIEENPLAALVHDVLGLESQKVQETLLMADSGWPVDAREDERVGRVFDETLEEAFRRAELTFSVDGDRSDPVAPAPDASFGSVLKQVWGERSVAADVPLLSWYKSNLEISCGVGLDRLGLEWNTDEAYGYEGDHVAMKGSWQPVVEALASGIDILYNSECTSIELLHPDGSTKHSAPPASTKGAPKTTPPAKKKPRLVTRSSAVNGSTRKAPLLSSTFPLRQSRRLLGADAIPTDRPVRSTQGKVDRYVPELSVKKAVLRSNDYGDDDETPKSAKKMKGTGIGSVVAREERTGSSVAVTLRNGKVLEADSVVCTLPLAMLQKRRIHFQPPLPPAKQQAVDSLGSGLLNKCALSFPQVFWPNSDFLGFADKANSYLVLNIHRITGKPCLVFMYGGSFAEDIESWSDQDIVSDCLRVLSKICSIRSVPDPIDYHITRWSRENFSGMAFSYVPPGVKGMQSLRAISEPILDFSGEKPLLQFAGEHTTAFHPSTIHGAFLSGIREAYRLDCAVDPEGVENLVFNDDEIYEPTFTLPRSQKAAASNPSENCLSAIEALQKPQGSAKNRGRHRSARGMMRLRPRSAQSPQLSPRTRKEATQEAPEPRARSNRYQFGRLSKGTGVGAADKDSNEYGVASQPRDLDAAEDRILLRSFESFGDDYEFIRNRALPIYGSDRKRTLLQVRDRCRKLLRSAKTVTGKAKAARIRREWFSDASNVAGK
eukprot:scaffold6647_cov166-Amphora_coffeaeformis.AAC.8